jgi:hypothetical protein
MTPSPYLIQFLGGRFHGLRKPCDAAPISTRLEMPGPDLALRGAVAARREIYEHRQTTVAFIDGAPVVIFQFQHVGANIDAPRPKRTSPWTDRIRRMLRRLKRRPRLRPQAPGYGIRVPAGHKNAVLHTWN